MSRRLVRVRRWRSRGTAPFVGAALLALCGAGAADAQTTTFTKDVAPILQQKCIQCHRSGEMAPMALRTYAEARPWARSIRNKVFRGEMPPWFIDKTIGIQHYKNDSSLSEREVATIVKWVDAGAPEGNPSDMPP